tara:strand:- start:136 stop:609 length:474 start_codon:yes stop_codon:yes gene_type:complete
MNLKMIIIAMVFLSPICSQTALRSESVKITRLENFKNNYSGKTIRFIGPGEMEIQGELVNVTSENFIVSVGTNHNLFSHKKIDHVLIVPQKPEFLLATSVSVFGGAIGYLTLIVSKENFNTQHERVFTFVGATLGALLGRDTFYKPLKIDISGKTYG